MCKSFVHNRFVKNSNDANRRHRQRRLGTGGGLPLVAGPRCARLRARRPRGRSRQHGRPRRARARHRVPRSQRAQLPAARPAIRRARGRTHQSDMSFSVSCAGCGLEYSGRRPFAQPANAARPGFLALLWEIGRWLRTARAARTTSAVARRVPRRARLLAAVPPPLPRAVDLGALVDGARPRARVPGRVRDPVLRQPRHARVRPLPLAHRHRRQPPLRGRDRRAARQRLRLGSASARYGARADGVELRVGDGDVAALRPASSSRRTPTRRSRCSRTRATTSGACSAASRTRANDAVLHTDSRFLPRNRRARASWNYRLGDDGRPTITYHLNRLQALEAERDYCVTLNERRRRGARARALHLRPSAVHGRRRCARSASCRALAAARHAVRRRVLRQRLPRGRARERRRRRARARGGRGEVGGLRGDADARAARRRARNVFRYPVSYCALRPRRAARARAAAARCSRSTAATSSRCATRDHFDGGAAQAGGASSSPATRRSSACSCSTQPRVLGYVFNPVTLLLVLSRRRLARLHGRRARTTRSASGCPRCCAGRSCATSTASGCTSRRSSGSTRATSTRSRSRATRCGRGSTSATTTARGRSPPCCTAGARELTNRSLARLLLRYPLQPLQVIALIHFQALRLWLKRVPFHHKPPFVPGEGSVRT